MEATDLHVTLLASTCKEPKDQVNLQLYMVLGTVQSCHGGCRVTVTR